MATLTPRQQEIKALQDQGKNPAEIARKLRISRNAVYQQIRRMGGGRSASGGRQSSRTASRATAHRPTRAPESPEPVDPLTATRERLAAVKIEHREAEHQRDAAIKALDSLDAEVKRLEQAEAVLSGKAAKATAGPAKSISSRQRPAQRASEGKTNGKPAEVPVEKPAEAASTQSGAEATASAS